METLISDRICEIRIQFNHSYERFAKNMGIKVYQVIEWENGKPVSGEMINKICSVYGVNKEWLKSGKGEMLSYSSIALKQVSCEYGLSESEQIIIRRCFTLKPADRQRAIKMLGEYIENL